jgi:hypothetical protein
MLNVTLANLYPTQDESYRIVDRAGLNRAQISFRAKALDNWYEIIKAAQAQHRLVALVEAVLQEQNNPDLTLALEALTATPSAALPTQPAVPTVDSKTLRDILSKHFDADALQELVFELKPQYGVDYDNLDGPKAIKIIKLIQYFEHRSIYQELVTAVYAKRPAAFNTPGS